MKLRITSAIGALLFSAQGAFALCSAPQLENPNDIIMQLRSSVSGNGQSHIGTGAALGVNSLAARSKGAIYFDTASNDLLLCDGTNWNSMGSTGDDGGTSGTTGTCYSYKKYTDPQYVVAQSPVLSANIPSNERGKGNFRGNISVYGSGAHKCEIQVETNNGWKFAGVVHGGNTNTFEGTFKVADNNDGSYTWKNYGNYENLDERTGFWTGRVRAIATGGSDPKCSLYLYEAERTAGCAGG